MYNHNNYNYNYNNNNHSYYGNYNKYNLTNNNTNNYNSTNYNYLNQNIPIIGSWDTNEKKSFSKFRNSFSIEDRINESIIMMKKYPDRIPIICEKGLGKDNPDIDKNKYLVPMDLTVGNFLVVIRKRIKLQPYNALFLMINGSIPPTTANFKELYHRYKDIDGYLYVTYTKENVFG
jgi:GABA(A) receptor-associated protein